MRLLPAPWRVVGEPAVRSLRGARRAAAHRSEFAIAPQAASTGLTPLKIFECFEMAS
jgi:hypothetical protein